MARVQQRRREAIRAILMAGEPPIAEQRDLVELLKSKGIPAAQPSVSRDLRDLGAFRIDGRYQILDWSETDEEHPIRKVKGVIVKILTVAPNQILIVTEPGAGAFVEQALEASGLEDIVGTTTGNSTVVIYTDNKFFRGLVWRLLKHYLGPGLGEEKKEEGEQDAVKPEK